MCAPSEKFLNMGGPLAMGLGAVLVSTLGKLDLFMLMKAINILILMLNIFHILSDN